MVVVRLRARNLMCARVFPEAPAGAPIMPSRLQS